MPLSRVVVDFIKTCGEPGILIDVTPKMEPKDKDNPKSEQVQGTDAEGNLKWTCTVSVSVPGLTKKVHEHLAITLISKTKPCTTIPEGSRVIVDDLTMGTMKAEKTGYTQFFSASAVRPVSVQAPQPAPR